MGREPDRPWRDRAEGVEIHRRGLLALQGFLLLNINGSFIKLNSGREWKSRPSRRRFFRFSSDIYEKVSLLKLRDISPITSTTDVRRGRGGLGGMWSALKERRQS